MSYTFTIKDIYEAHNCSRTMIFEQKDRSIGSGNKPSREMNFSSEFSYLVAKVGRFVETYQSDLIISVNAFTKDIDTMAENLRLQTDGSANADMIAVFGLRENGVDHDSYLLSQMNGASSDVLTYYYRKIYTLKVNMKIDTDGDLIVSSELKDVTREIPQAVYRYKGR